MADDQRKTAPPRARPPASLSAAGIRIHRYRESDIDRLYEAVIESRDELSPYMPWCHPEYARRDSEQWVHQQLVHWDQGKEYQFAIEDAATGRYLGGGGLNELSRLNKRANLGYWVRTSAAGRGVITRASALIARFAIYHLGLARVEIYMSVENLASIRVAEKLGAQREGVLRKRILLHDRSHGRRHVLLVQWRRNSRPGGLLSQDLFRAGC